MWRLALSKHVSAATTAIGTTEILCRSASVAVMQSKCNITVASCTIDCSYAEPRRTVLYSSFGFVILGLKYARKRVTGSSTQVPKNPGIARLRGARGIQERFSSRHPSLRVCKSSYPGREVETSRPRRIPRDVSLARRVRFVICPLPLAGPPG
jgi:hypothetical protein